MASITGTLLLAAVAVFTANSPGKLQTPATNNSGKVSQDSAKQSSTAFRDASKPAMTGTRKIPCKTPENASQCYWTHGRLDFYTDYPPLRMWKIGTNRRLGVFSGPSRFPPRDTRQLYLPELPANLSRVYKDPGNWEPPEELLDPYVYWSDSVFADFEVCPLAPEKRAKMQPVCVESAKNIFVQK